MLGDDLKMLARLEPVVRRVMIVDAQVATARLLTDLMKGLGAREIIIEADEKEALDAVRDFEPTLLFVERAGPRFDGEILVNKLRRSRMDARRIPVIMITADATATTIKGARDVGVHEFMVKPFTTGDLVRRIINVATKPRPWVEAVGYVGPDRRRFNSGEYKGPRKRQSEAEVALDPIAAEMDQAGKIIVSALDQFSRDPAQARRALIAQAETLKRLATVSGRPALEPAATALASAAGIETSQVEDLRPPAVALVALLNQGAGVTKVA